MFTPVSPFPRNNLISSDFGDREVKEDANKIVGEFVGLEKLSETEKDCRQAMKGSAYRPLSQNKERIAEWRGCLSKWPTTVSPGVDLFRLRCTYIR